MPRRSKKVKRQTSKRASTAATRPPSPPSYGGWFLGVLVLALGTRIVYLLELHASPLSDLKLGDALSYHAWALEIASGNWLGSEIFYQAPLYPYFLAVHYAAFGESLLVVRWSQAILGAIACVLLARAGTRFFDPLVGVAVGMLLALYPPAIFFGGLVQKTTLGLFFLCLLLWLASQLSSRAPGAVTVAAGIALGALSLTRENALVLALPLLAWVAWKVGSTTRGRLVSSALFAGGLLIALGPVLARNFVVGGELHLTTSQMGPNLYIGNHAEATGTYKPLRPGRQDARFERTDARDLAEAAEGRALSPAEVSHFYTQQVVDYIRTEPGDWIRLMGRKLALVWNATEVGDTEDFYAYALQSTLLRTLRIFHFGWIVPLALLGGIITWRERDRLWLLYALVGTYSLSVVVFYVFARYRFPLVPIVLLFAAVALVRGRSWFGAHSPRLWAPALAATLLVAAFSNASLVDHRAMQATTHFNLGYGLAQYGKAAEATEQFRLALTIDPAFPKARNELGIVLAQEGKLDQAAVEFEEALRLDPDFAQAEANLGELRLQQSRPDEAREHFERALLIEPENAPAHDGLAKALFQQKDLAGAVEHFERSLSVEPDNAAAHNNLGVIAALRGDLEEAIVRFEAALAIDPDYDQAKENLNRALEAS